MRTWKEELALTFLMGHWNGDHTKDHQRIMAAGIVLEADTLASACHALNNKEISTGDPFYSWCYNKAIEWMGLTNFKEFFEESKRMGKPFNQAYNILANSLTITSGEEDKILSEAVEPYRYELSGVLRPVNPAEFQI